jgi:hypothetical protein
MANGHKRSCRIVEVELQFALSDSHAGRRTARDLDMFWHKRVAIHSTRITDQIFAQKMRLVVSVCARSAWPGEFPTAFGERSCGMMHLLLAASLSPSRSLCSLFAVDLPPYVSATVYLSTGAEGGRAALCPQRARQFTYAANFSCKLLPWMFCAGPATLRKFQFLAQQRAFVFRWKETQGWLCVPSSLITIISQGLEK